MGNTDILITGATGFVGSQLLDELRETGRVRVIVRDRSRLDDIGGIDVVEGDLSEAKDVRRALAGIRTAYYLVHSMEPGDDGDFAGRDRQLAEAFLRAAEAEEVERIVYLGGVQPGGQTSRHLQSRKEVEEVLGGGTPALVGLRASMVIGAHSDSFRTLAQIVSRLPILALPTWRSARTQPIAIADVVAALVAARTVAPGVYEVGGPDEVTIEQMCQTIGELLGDEPPTVDLPFSSSRLEGAASAVVADSSREVLQPLLEGMHDDLRVTRNELESTFDVRPTPFRVAAERALADMDGDL